MSEFQLSSEQMRAVPAAKAARRPWKRQEARTLAGELA
jgi:hypothetical protein